MRRSSAHSRGDESKLVLDAWPVVEWLKNEPPFAQRAQDIFQRAEDGRLLLLMSRLNLGEVYYSAARRWGLAQAEVLLGKLGRLPITIVPVSDELVMAAARLKAAHTISYADCFAVALAQREEAPLVTGDAELRDLATAGVLRVKWFGA